MASDPPQPPDCSGGPTAGPPQPGKPAPMEAAPRRRPASSSGRRTKEQRRDGHPGRLDLGDAIHDGWQAFCRAPRVFAAFTLVVNLLIVLQQPLLLRIGNVTRPSGDPRDWALYGLGLALMAAVFLWGCLGMARGSLLALQGQRPTFMQLMRWDGIAWLRLVRAWLRLAALAGLPGGVSLVLFGLPLMVAIEEPSLEQMVEQALGRETTFLLALLLLALLLLGLALTLAAWLYLLANQAFLLQIVLVEGRGGTAAVERGRQLVDPQWPLVLLLVIVTVILNGLGLLACAVGSLAAWPAGICISTAAYRQLRQGEETRQGLTADAAGTT